MSFKRLIWEILLVIIVLNAASSPQQVHVDFTPKKEFLPSYLPYIQKGLEITSILPLLQKRLSSENGTKCFKDIELTLNGLQNGEEWAFKMFDASTKIPKDLIEGNLYWQGSQETCRNVASPHFQTHFCWFNFIKKFPALQMDFCLPNSCQGKYFNDIAFALSDLKIEAKNFDLVGPPFEFICSEEFEKIPTHPSVIISLIVCFILIGIVIFATIFEVFLESRKMKAGNVTIYGKQSIAEIESAKKSITGKTGIKEMKINKTSVAYNGNDQFVNLKSSNELVELLLCFSAVRNWKKLINVQKKELSCVNGIRSLSMLIIIYGHVILLPMSTSDNPTRFFSVMSNHKFVMFTSFLFMFRAVDTFFILSSFLATYFYLKDREQGKAKSWSQHTLLRYLRLSPTFYFVLFLHICFFSKLKMKNAKAFIAVERLECSNKLWSTLLFVGNFFHVHCFGFSWYVAVDMQFHLLFPLFLQIITRWKIFGLITLVSTLLASTLTIFTFSYINDFGSLKIILSDYFKVITKAEDYYDIIYLVPQCRIPPFIAGIICGWVCYKTETKIYLTKSQALLLFFLSCVSFYVAGFLEYHFDLTSLQAAIFTSLQVNLWSLSICILIFLCFSGYGGIINNFLSLKIWSFLSEISYCCYILQESIIFFYSPQFFENNHLQLLGVLQVFSWCLQYIIAGGLLLYIAVEAPSRNIVNLYLKSKQKIT